MFAAKSQKSSSGWELFLPLAPLCDTLEQVLREGGAGGTVTPEPMDFRGPSRGPIEMTLRNQHVKTEDLFLFWRSYQNPEKTVACFLEDLFFFLEITSKSRTKLWHFLRLFYSLQNRKFVMFELAPGPRSALGAPALELHRFVHHGT